MKSLKFEPMLLITARDEPHAGLIAGALDSAGIKFFTQSRGLGGFYGTAWLLGVDIYVSESDLEKAERLLNELESGLERKQGTCLIYSLPPNVKARKRLRKHF